MSLQASRYPEDPEHAVYPPEVQARIDAVEAEFAAEDAAAEAAAVAAQEAEIQAAAEANLAWEAECT